MSAMPEDYWKIVSLPSGKGSFTANREPRLDRLIVVHPGKARFPLGKKIEALPLTDCLVADGADHAPQIEPRKACALSVLSADVSAAGVSSTLPHAQATATRSV